VDFQEGKKLGIQLRISGEGNVVAVRSGKDRKGRHSRGTAGTRWEWGLAETTSRREEGKLFPLLYSKNCGIRLNNLSLAKQKKNPTPPHPKKKKKPPKKKTKKQPPTPQKKKTRAWRKKNRSSPGRGESRKGGTKHFERGMGQNQKRISQRGTGRGGNWLPWSGLKISASSPTARFDLLFHFKGEADFVRGLRRTQPVSNIPKAGRVHRSSNKVI